MLAEENERGRLARSAGIIMNKNRKENNWLNSNRCKFRSSVCLSVCLPALRTVCSYTYVRSGSVCLYVCTFVRSGSVCPVNACLWVGSFCFQSRKMSFSPFKHPEHSFVKLNLNSSSLVLDTLWRKHLRTEPSFDGARGYPETGVAKHTIDPSICI